MLAVPSIRMMIRALGMSIAVVAAFVPHPQTPPPNWSLLSAEEQTHMLVSPDSCTLQQTTIPPVQIVDSMPEPLPETCKNSYYFLRHGLSTANVDSIISSNRYDLAYTDKHGLTETGYQQGVMAARQLMEYILDDEDESSSIAFVSSPFARARQTAAACLEGLSALSQTNENNTRMNIQETIYLHPNLMERSFGRLDGEAIETYAYVWPLDAFNVTHTAFDVESVAAVCHRFRTVITELEETFNNHTHVVLVSHADVLQIAQLYAARAENVGTFSSYRFKNGEVRKMILNDPTSLPEPSPLEKPDRSTKQG